MVDSDHPALAPTGCDYWQDEFWRALFTAGERHAVSHRLEGMPSGFRPIVTVVPDLHHSMFISPLFEIGVGEGRLIVCGLNIDADSPTARLLKRSIWRYAASDDFRPKWRVGREWFRGAFLMRRDASGAKPAKNEAFVDEMDMANGQNLGSGK